MRGRLRSCGPLALLALAGCTALDETWLTQEPLPDRKPREVRAEFTGNDRITSRTLRQAVRPDMLGLSRGLEAEGAAFDAADAIAEHYRGEGFADASVTYRVEGPTPRAGAPDLVVVHFAVDEGQPVTVSRLELTGNRVFGRAELLRLWSRRSSGALGLGDPLYVQAGLRAFAADIRDFYWRHGYLEAAVDGPDVARAPGARSVQVALRITEGRQFRFGRVDVAPAIRDALGPDLPPLPAGEVFTTRRAQEFLLALRNALLRRGHPRPQVGIPPLPDVTQLPQPLIDLAVAGDPGPTAVFGAIEIVGNDRTRTSLVRDKLGFRAGDRYDGIAEQKALERLYQTGLFRRVTFERGAIADGRLPLRVRVEELDARSVELLLGYGSYELLRGGVRYEDRNLFGTGRELTVEGRGSQRGYRASTTLTDRDLFDTATTGSLGAELFARQQPSFTDRAAGATFTLRRELAGPLVARVGYSYLDHRGGDQVADPAVVEDYTQGTVFVELRRDARDNFVLPDSGTVVFVRADFTDPAFGASVSFDRLRTGAAWVLPLGEDTHVAWNAQIGWLWPHEGSAGVPLPERFFGGGHDSVRSFREDELGPRNAQGTFVGGEFSNLFNVELRQRLVGPLEGTLFADAGNVGSDIQDYGFADLRYALGAGLRLQLPIGPVRLDTGWNPDRRTGEDEWVVHFAIGYPF